MWIMTTPLCLQRRYDVKLIEDGSQHDHGWGSRKHLENPRNRPERQGHGMGQ